MAIVTQEFAGVNMGRYVCAYFGVGLLALVVTSMKPSMVIGHRGAAGYAPENTIASFEKAIELGVQMIEFDVRLCKTGQLVVIHDETVDRTTNGEGLVSDMTIDELKELDAGDGQSIPTLQEVLDVIDRRIWVNIELKGDHTAEPVADVIKKYISKKGWRHEDFLVTSFNHYIVSDFKIACPDVPTGAISIATYLDYGSYLQRLGVQVAVIFVDSAIDKIISDIRARGVEVVIFTVNDQACISRMLRLGVNGIISDYPDRVFEQMACQ